ncbi:hypothetical protein E6O75_ATG08636 [Venturia nashicola]|uniref:Uncharacterized protein n=1 Tax=Venturia nashicola TaxID=86259 RepID=A0A4Z1P052_9PEZI|nr:hypothetical protein E6O75_ATG08636 [Venturia nashicola]
MQTDMEAEERGNPHLHQKARRPSVYGQSALCRKLGSVMPGRLSCGPCLVVSVIQWHCRVTKPHPFPIMELSNQMLLCSHAAVCLHVCLQVCLQVCLYACLYVCLLLVCLLVCLLATRKSACISACMASRPHALRTIKVAAGRHRGLMDVVWSAVVHCESPSDSPSDSHSECHSEATSGSGSGSGFIRARKKPGEEAFPSFSIPPVVDTSQIPLMESWIRVLHLPAALCIAAHVISRPYVAHALSRPSLHNHSKERLGNVVRLSLVEQEMAHVLPISAHISTMSVAD